MNIVPLHDNVLVQRELIEEKKSPGGIFIPKTGQSAPVFCEVIALGPDCPSLPNNVKEGSRVIVSTFAGVDVELDGEKYVMVKVADILGWMPTPNVKPKPKPRAKKVKK